MTRLFRSKSCGLVGITEFNSTPPSPLFHHSYKNDDEEEQQQQQEQEEDDDEEEEEEAFESEDDSGNPISTPLISPGSRFGVRRGEGQSSNLASSRPQNSNQFHILDILVAALRKSLLVTCSVEREDASSMDISWPTEVRHVSHVTFDRFDGFLGLPTELEHEVPTRAPSASVSVFGVSAKSMQCSYDDRGNSVPTILLMMQRRLYSEDGLKAEGIFRINAENSQEEYVRDQLNKGVVPYGIDVHCLAGLMKAWLRELPTGVLDSLSPEQVMHCNTEEDCTQLVKLLPQTEAALLDWAINLMADVVQHEQYNKMNARNIAMVFAPNMTQMADPLTALIHAVQVMNFLKALILKIIREREDAAAKARLLSPCSHSPAYKNDSHLPNIINTDLEVPLELSDKDFCTPEGPAISKFLRAATMGRLEYGSEEKIWSFLKKSDGGDEEFETVSGSSTPALSESEMGAIENGFRGEYSYRDWLNLRGVRRLNRHRVFQFGKPANGD